MEGLPNKQYGLILPKTARATVAPTLVTKPSVFKDSDSEDEAPGDWMQKTLQKEKYGGARSKHSKAEIEKILKEDPTIYEYDEVYDEIEKKRNEVKAAKQAEKTERKPRYIQHLMATAEKRKKENERRIARQVQKEREAEGDEFADKEVFITSSYKKKLEEMKAAEEEEKRQERLETIGDVTKQGDLSGFYRHLYEKVVLDVENEDDEVDSTIPKSKKREKQQAKSRQYRKRKSSESAGEEDGTSAVKRQPESEFSTNKTAENVEISSSGTKTETSISDDTITPVTAESENPDADSDSEPKNSVKQEPREEKLDDADDAGEEEKEIVPEEPPKPKISVWEKRTVGEIFENALQRYYERKALRLMTVGS